MPNSRRLAGKGRRVKWTTGLSHAEPGLVRLGQRDQRLVHLGEVDRPTLALGEHHAGCSKVRARSWRWRIPMGGSASTRGVAPELSTMSSSRVNKAGFSLIPGIQRRPAI